MKSMIITYYRKNVYGKEVIYANSKDQADCIYALTGQKTITRGQMAALKMLGHNFNEVLAPKEEYAI